MPGSSNQTQTPGTIGPATRNSSVKAKAVQAVASQSDHNPYIKGFVSRRPQGRFLEISLFTFQQECAPATSNTFPGDPGLGICRISCLRLIPR